MKELPRIRAKRENIEDAQKRIKLSTVTTIYMVNDDNSVSCILSTELVYKGKVKASFVTYGVAHLHKGDKFDFEKGKRISLAKAERIAYKMAYTKCHKVYNENKTLKEDLYAFLKKAKNQVEHNDEYIKDLSLSK